MRKNCMETTTKSFRAKIGDAIRQIREERGMSQGQLAEKAGLIRTTVNKIERGKFSVSVDLLERICDVLGARIRMEEY